MKKVCCFGELLLRLSPALNRQWIAMSGMPVFIGGAELNVANALAIWNMPVKYVTALPGNYLADEIINELQSKKIDTASIIRSGDRIGTYYLPQGADLQNAGVIYDRAHSSFSHLKPGQVDWKEVLEDCDWFHFSAITPALHENLIILCKEALEAASAKGMTISVDLNYREKLWQYGKQPATVMPELVRYCTVVMGNLWATEALLGIASPIATGAGKTRAELLEAAGESMLQLHRQYPQATTLAYTYRMEQTYLGVLQHGREMVSSKEYALHDIVDKAGSGDCFMAGLIYGIKNHEQLQQIIDYAAAAATGKLLEKGDGTHQTIEQVKARIS
jgi:2-dehydro-3-deoxygluconokinase